MKGCFQKVFAVLPTKISALPEAHLGSAVNGPASINPSTIKQMKVVSSKKSVFSLLLLTVVKTYNS